MKKLLIKIFILFLLVGVINISIRSLVYKRDQPFYWGSQAVAQKRNYLVQNKGLYNTIFVGSSKTYHQVNPVLFDSLNQVAGTKSFNFGVQGMLPPESFIIYKNLIQNDSLKLKYAFLELDWLGTVTYDNLHTWRSFYWLDQQNLSLILKSFFTSQMPLHVKAWNALSRSINYLEIMYNFGYLTEYFKYLTNEEDKPELSNKFIVENHGYEPMVSEGSFSTNELSKLNEVKTASSTSFVKHKQVSNYVNEEYLAVLKDLIETSNQKGIHLVFIIPPQWKAYQYDELIPLAAKLDKNHFIEMADIAKYPEFYKTEYMFDADHLNFKGAILYTKALAKNFKQI